MSQVCAADNTCRAAECGDGIQNGDELAIDCGGGTCAGCPDGNACNAAIDCLSGVCTDNICQVPTCVDGVENGAETALDCGGALCDPCADGLACLAHRDCVNGYCANEVCTAPTCVDGVQNGAETSVDCGGNICDACANGQACAANTDCVSNVCTNNVCVPAECNDAVKNGEETGVDCGGAICAPCNDNQPCAQARDCLSGVCINEICQAPTCDDAVQNGDETGLNCGGAICNACADGLACQANRDCLSGVCTNNVCQAQPASMVFKTEMKRDSTVALSVMPVLVVSPVLPIATASAACAQQCLSSPHLRRHCSKWRRDRPRLWRSICDACGDGLGCAANTDCISGVCTNNVCQAPTCEDNVLNGDETDVDCGGAICNACDEGQACAANNDCASDVCADNVCAPCRIFVGWGDNNGDVTHGSIWSYQGNQGVAAANAMCAQVAADARACTYAELVTANQQGDFNQEFVNSQGETGWVHRVATTVTVNGRDIAPGAGARCVDWTYGSNHLADGEYFTVNADGLTFTFDPDPTVRGPPIAVVFSVELPAAVQRTAVSTFLMPNHTHSPRLRCRSCPARRRGRRGPLPNGVAPSGSDFEAHVTDALDRDLLERSEEFLEAHDRGEDREHITVLQSYIDEGLLDADALFVFGDALFEHEFSSVDGWGAGEFGIKRVHDGVRGGLDTFSCASCHSLGGADGAGTFQQNAFLYGDGERISSAIPRNAPSLLGVGLIQSLADEMSRELAQIKHDALQSAEAGNETITVDLLTKTSVLAASPRALMVP